MKQNKIIMLTIGVLLLFSISGCQNAATLAPSSPPTQSSSPTPLQSSNPTLEAYPSTANQANPSNPSYPAPSDSVVTSAAYPSPQDGSTITWADAEKLLFNGQVTGVILTQSLEVTLTLKTGQTVKTTPPAADAVKNAISTCGDLCKNISVTTQ